MKYALALALASLLLSGSAHAEHAMVVKVRGLNLHTTAGAAVAVQRMNDAAAAFCTTPLRSGVREMDVTTLKCRRDLAARAAVMLGSPEVSYLQSQLGPTKVIAAQDADAMAGAGATGAR
ncbi:MAG: hypothetical protein JWP23_2500 [Phenylobacterium sp.]|nr:hypothetical protein [Phenylobacterium sp.]